MYTLEVGAPKKIRWGLIALVIMVLLGALLAVQFAMASANDARKKPLNLSAEEAAGKCIGEVQLDYRAAGQTATAKTEDFSITGNNPGQMGVAGKIAISGATRNVNCLIDVVSSGGSTITSYRIH